MEKAPDGAFGAATSSPSFCRASEHCAGATAPPMKPTAQKCANDVQISVERAFPHCARVFGARKKPLWNRDAETYEAQAPSNDRG